MLPRSERLREHFFRKGVYTMPSASQEIWKDRYEKWLHYLHNVAGAIAAGREIPLGPSAPPPTPPAADAYANTPAKVVYCAPHPDDEAISGVLALRLRLDSGARVTNIAITLGSDKSQRPRRLRELESACQALGFDLIVPHHPQGFEQVTESNRNQHPDEWAAKVEVLREIFDREVPDVVMAPHAQDFNTAHVGTHLLVVEALGGHLERSGRGPVLFVQAEFWHQIERPNLMVGLTPELVAAQLVGIGEHGDEMRRNPYHLLHPCRLMDNVRRGSEVVGGQGAAAQPFTFAELYHVVFMKGREIVPPRPGGCIISPTQKIDVAWLKSQFD
jgi:LmbE family N-acetylglucosaminyl deacetylase